MLHSGYICRLLKGYRAVRSFNRTYLSHEFKATMSKRLDIPQIDKETRTLFGQTDKLMPFEVDAFIDRLPPKEDRRGEILEQLLKLRATEHTTIAPYTLQHSVINYLVSMNIDDLLMILSERLQYGIFIDAFSGCYLMDILLEKQKFAGAAQIAAELLVQEDFENELVQALAIKSAFEYVKDFLKKPPSSEEPKKTEEPADPPIRVRVKFIRNPPEHEMINTKDLSFNLMGKVILMFSRNSTNDDVKQNGLLLGNVLISNVEETAKLLKDASISYSKDVLDTCIQILQKHPNSNAEKTEEILSFLEKLKSTSTTPQLYADTIEGFIQQAKDKNEASLIEQQTENYEKWLKDREETFNEVVTVQKRHLREQEIEETVANIESEKQKLWFFETQDKLDLEIYRKQVRYPKRWFGKKKKPRAIDDNYVPPEIRAK